MKKLSLLITWLVLAVFVCHAQKKSIVFKAEAGASVSIGEEVLREVKSQSNLFAVEYIDNSNYKYPGFRFRVAAMKPLTSVISVGIRTGANVHYFDPNTYGQKLTYFTFPLQAVADIVLKRLDTRALLFTLAAGHRFRKADEYPFSYKGGLLLSAELSFGNTGSSKGIYYKLGLEYGKENASYDYVPNWDFLKNESISWSFHRKQGFLAIGVNF